MKKLFDGQSADGQSDSIEHTGGRRTAIITGDFGGGTVTIQISPDGGTTWVTMTDQDGTDKEWTDDATVTIGPLDSCHMRFDLTGATNPDLDAWL